MSPEPSNICDIHRRLSRCLQAPSRTACPGPRRTIIFDRAATNRIPQLPRPSAAMDLRSSRVDGMVRNRWTASIGTGGRHVGIGGRHRWNTHRSPGKKNGSRSGRARGPDRKGPRTSRYGTSSTMPPSRSSRARSILDVDVGEPSVGVGDLRLSQIRLDVAVGRQEHRRADPFHRLGGPRRAGGGCRRTEDLPQPAG